MWDLKTSTVSQNCCENSKWNTFKAPGSVLGIRSVLNDWQSLYSSQQINEMSDPIKVSHRYTLIPFAIPEAYRRRFSIIPISPPRPGHTVGTQPVCKGQSTTDTDPPVSSRKTQNQRWSSFYRFAWAWTPKNRVRYELKQGFPTPVAQVPVCGL